MNKGILNIADLNKLNPLSIEREDLFVPTSKVSIDSRNIKSNSIFIAIKGDKYDGHQFVNQAINNGAKAVVVSDNDIFKSIDNVCKILVSDTVKALGDIAKVYRQKLNAKVISITGSNGKTSTKDYISQILSTKYKVTSTKSNNNNHIGVPLTILSADEKTEILVLEHGTNHFNEIKYTANIAIPDYAIITNINDSHTEFLKDKEGILKEKKELLNAAILNNGIAILNIDDEKLKGIVSEYEKVITFGTDVNSDYRLVKDDGTIKIKYGSTNYSFSNKIYDKAFLYNFLVAFIIGNEFGIDAETIKRIETEIKQPKGRLNIVQLNNAIIIDDTYNSNPASLKNGIDYVADYDSDYEKILILGDMFELGDKSIELHKSFAHKLNDKSFKEVLLIGNHMKYLYEEIRSTMNAKYFSNEKELSNYIDEININEKLIYIKGSRGMKMEQYLEKIREKVK